MKHPYLIILRLSAICCLAQIALSWPLWYSGARPSFPLAPPGGLEFPDQPWWSMLQAGITVLLLVFNAVFPRYRRFLWMLPVWFLWLIVQDLNRLQPWTYFYLLAWGLLIVHQHGHERDAGFALKWLVAGVYAWGGFNKITPYFAVDNFPWFCEAFSWTKLLGNYPAAGYAVAVLELLFAPGLLWRVSRPVFRWIVPAFHVFIALALSPLGLDWNTVVIPWNIAMAGMVWVLFNTAEPAENKGLFKQMRTNPGAAGLLTLVWLMPVLNIFHAWPEALSWKMYSNTQTEASFYAETGAPCPQLAAVWNRHAFDDNRRLLLDDWAFEELHVPAFNSRYVHEQIAQYLCGCMNNPGSAGLHRLSVQRWNPSAEHWEKIPCTSLSH